MKVLLAMAMLGASIGAVVYLAGNWAAQDMGHLVPFAYGNPRGDTVEVQVAVSYRMTRLDPPRYDLEKKKRIPWSQWVKEHFELSDAAGTRINLARSNFANLLPEGKIGTPDFFLTGDLPLDGSFVLDYVPLGIAPSKHYRYEFDTNSKEQKFEFISFQWAQK